MKFMHTDKAHMQQSVSIYLLGLGAFYGPLSDRSGKRACRHFWSRACRIGQLCINIHDQYQFFFSHSLISRYKVLVQVSAWG